MISERSKLDLWYVGKNTHYDISESGYCNNFIFRSSFVRYNRLCKYDESNGNDKLLDIIANIYSCTSENILITNGTNEGIYILLNCLLERGDEIIVCEPFYVDVSSLINTEYVECKRVYFDVNRNFQLKSIFDVVTLKTKIIIINFPNNPSGLSITAQQQEELFIFAQRHNIFVISDDVFKEFYPADLPVIKGDYWISLNGVSKTYGYPGVRLGWIIASKDIVFKALCLKEAINVSTNVFSQCFAIRLLKHRNRILNKHNIHIKKNFNFIRRKLTSNPFFKLSYYCGGCCALIFFDVDRFRMDSIHFCQMIYDELGILITPGELFGIRNSFRIGLGMSHYRFKRIYFRLDDFCKTYNI